MSFDVLLSRFISFLWPDKKLSKSAIFSTLPVPESLQSSFLEEACKCQLIYQEDNVYSLHPLGISCAGLYIREGVCDFVLINIQGKLLFSSSIALDNERDPLAYIAYALADFRKENYIPFLMGVALPIDRKKFPKNHLFGKTAICYMSESEAIAWGEYAHNSSDSLCIHFQGQRKNVNFLWESAHYFPIEVSLKRRRNLSFFASNTPSQDTINPQPIYGHKAVEIGAARRCELEMRTPLWNQSATLIRCLCPLLPLSQKIYGRNPL